MTYNPLIPAPAPRSIGLAIAAGAAVAVACAFVVGLIGGATPPTSILLLYTPPYSPLLPFQRDRAHLARSEGRPDPAVIRLGP